MSGPFGPWASTLGADPAARLSTFWHRGMTMLSDIRLAAARPPRRHWLGLLAGAVALLTLPTLNLLPAAAQGDKPPTRAERIRELEKQLEAIQKQLVALRAEETPRTAAVADFDDLTGHGLMFLLKAQNCTACHTPSPAAPHGYLHDPA